MRLAFSTLACPGWSVEDVAANARAYGYDGIELRLLDGELIDPDLPTPARNRVRRVFDDAGLPIVAIDTSVRVAGDAEAAEQELRGWIEVAGAWAAPVLRVFGGAIAGQERDEAVATASTVLERIAPEAEQAGVGIALETHDAFASAATVGEVLRRVPSPAIGALWDTHHPYRSGESPEQVWELLAGRVLHTHVKDARKRPDDTWELTLLGEGEVPVADVIRLLRGRGYGGWISVEWEKKWHPEIPEPEQALPQHLSLLRVWAGDGD